MTSLYEFFLWLSFIFPLVFSAGPGNIMCAISGASNGFLKSLPFIIGLNLIYTIYSLLAGFGFAVLLSNFPLIFYVLQYIGVVYIFWLGIKFLFRKSVSGKEVKPELILRGRRSW